MFDTVIHSTLEIASDPGHWVFELVSGGIFFAIGSLWHTLWQKGHERDHHEPAVAELARRIAQLEADMDAINGDSPTEEQPADKVMAWLTVDWRGCGPECSENHTYTGRCEA